jgi:Phosphoenolpyruvate synthase/pyruvate phosphate dikinase
MAKNFKKGVKTRLKIMIPLIGDAKELDALLEPLKESFTKCLEDFDSKVARAVLKATSWGTMIELPRACLVADEIGKRVDFISFGTNDLTQTTLGLSRDDSGRFLTHYQEKGIYDHDPFEVLDQEGVGKLVSLALKLARKANPKIEVGVCGEHGGEPKSIEFFDREDFDTVSCSPFRVPVARLAAARSALMKKKTGRKSKKRK